MTNVFGININFNPSLYDESIIDSIINKKKGYSCIIDGNVLTIANKNEFYRSIINNATINTCDGSSIAAIASHIHNKKYKTYSGPEIFTKYIEQDYVHVIIGNTKEVITKLQAKLKENGINNNVIHIEVPFLAVEQFDYKSISTQLEECIPDFIWVSLGAPKQEYFIHYLYPHISRGFLFGIGAAVYLYLDNNGSAKKRREFCGFRFVWIGRLIKEPKKQFHRFWNYFIILPHLYMREKKKQKNNTY